MNRRYIQVACETTDTLLFFFTGRQFKAHKVILAACSKHFQELFDTAPPSHAGACYVILEATTADNMQALLEFMYKGEVHVSQDALSSFLKSGENLQVSMFSCILLDVYRLLLPVGGRQS